MTFSYFRNLSINPPTSVENRQVPQNAFSSSSERESRRGRITQRLVTSLAWPLHCLSSWESPLPWRPEFERGKDFLRCWCEGIHPRNPPEMSTDSTIESYLCSPGSPSFLVIYFGKSKQTPILTSFLALFSSTRLPYGQKRTNDLSSSWTLRTLGQVRGPGLTSSFEYQIGKE